MLACDKYMDMYSETVLTVIVPWSAKSKINCLDGKKFPTDNNIIMPYQ